MSIQPAPEIQAGLREEADAGGVSVDALIARAVTAYLHRESGLRSAPHAVSLRDRSAEMEWMAKPDLQFAGKPFLAFVSPGEQVPSAAGWVD
jgi:hypothetical protein